MEKDKKRKPVAKYFLNILLAIDQLGSALRGWDHDETLSSMYGKMKKHYGKSFRKERPVAWRIARLLNRIDREHCENAIEHDEGKNAVRDRNIAMMEGQNAEPDEND